MNRLFEAGTRISVNHRTGTVYPLGSDHVSIVFEDGEIENISRALVLQAFKNQTLKLFDSKASSLPIQELAPLSLKQIEKLAYINGVLQLKEKNCSRDRIRAVIKQVSVNYPHTKAPSVSTVYNWVKKAMTLGEKADSEALLSTTKRNRDARIPLKVDQLMDDAIDLFYMQPTQSSIVQTYRYFKEQYQKLYPTNKSLSPHRTTFYRRVDALCPIEKTLKREGRSAAKKLKRTAINEMRAETILEQLQLDAVHLNIPLYDKEGNKLGTPVIHIAIDVFSRCVVGFEIELNSETSSGVIECLKSAISLKYHEDHPYTKNAWLMHGKPFEIVTDGGSAYNSETVISFVAMLKIVRSVNASYTPWHKGIVERFNRTLRSQFARLFKSYVGRKEDGRDLHTLSKYNEKVTFCEFRELLTCYIVDDYNQKPHNSLLERTPTNVWLECAEFTPPIIPSSLASALLLYGKVESAVLSPIQGIRHNNVFYNSQELQNAFLAEYGEKALKGMTVKFFYNPMNINSISIKIDQKLIAVPCFKSDFPVHEEMSLAEHKAGRDKAKKRAREETEHQSNQIAVKTHFSRVIESDSEQKEADRSRKQVSSLPLTNVNEKLSTAEELGTLYVSQEKEEHDGSRDLLVELMEEQPSLQSNSKKKKGN